MDPFNRFIFLLHGLETKSNAEVVSSVKLLRNLLGEEIGAETRSKVYPICFLVSGSLLESCLADNFLSLRDSSRTISTLTFFSLVLSKCYPADTSSPVKLSGHAPLLSKIMFFITPILESTRTTKDVSKSDCEEIVSLSYSCAISCLPAWKDQVASVLPRFLTGPLLAQLVQLCLYYAVYKWETPNSLTKKVINSGVGGGGGNKDISISSLICLIDIVKVTEQSKKSSGSSSKITDSKFEDKATNSNSAETVWKSYFPGIYSALQKIFMDDFKR